MRIPKIFPKNMKIDIILFKGLANDLEKERANVVESMIYYKSSKWVNEYYTMPLRGLTPPKIRSIVIVGFFIQFSS